MNITVLILGIVLLITSFTLLNENLSFGQTLDSTTGTGSEDILVLRVVSNTEGVQHSIEIPVNQLIFNVILHYDKNNVFKSITLTPKPELNDFYQEVGFSNKSHDIVFIYPLFTQAAYSNNGFYDYYNKKCDSKCLTLPIPDHIKGGYQSSLGGAFVLTILNYSQVTDEDVDKNPDILKQYKRVIVLHNEYVTKKEFDAITNHPDVVFLYPNALYAEVKTDYNAGTITLVRGHGYPSPDIRNGFDWKNDNSKQEYNSDCNNWNFYKKENHTFLNCYPEYRLLYAKQLLRTLQKSDPTELYNDIANWLRYPEQKELIVHLLDDFDVSGEYIPLWVKNPASLTLNGEITKSDFAQILTYLSKNHII